MVAKVIVDLAHSQVDTPYDYDIPKALENDLRVGDLVEVSFHHQIRLAMVLKIQKTSVQKNRKPLRQKLHDSPPLPLRLHALALFLNKQWAVPLWAYIRLFLPNVLLMKKQRVVRVLATADARFKEPFKGKNTLLLSQFKHPSLMEEGMKQGVYVTSQSLEPRHTLPKVLWAHALQSPKRLTPLQEQLIAQLQATPSGIEAKALAAHYGTSLATLKRLETQGALRLEERLKPLDTIPSTATFPELNDEQTDACERLLDTVKQRQPFVLEGVHNSGKTLVMLHAVKRLVREKKNCIIVVPEGALLDDFIERLAAALDEPFAQLHSGLTDTQYYRQWWAVKSGEVHCAIGTRLALFAPFEEVEALFCEEAHHPTHNSPQGAVYHMLDVCDVFLQQNRIPSVFISATPAVEHKRAMQQQTLAYASLKETPLSPHRPAIQTIDMRHYLTLEDPLTPPVIEAIQDALAAGYKTLLWLNRKGEAQSLWCPKCHHTVRCADCGVPLHVYAHHTVCPVCRQRSSKLTHCLYDDTALKAVGYGLDGLKVAVETLFPNAVVSVFESAHRTQHPQANIILGTQILAHGKDWPDVKVIGVIDADTFTYGTEVHRAHEAYSWLHHLAGRAGRRAFESRVLIQTYQPDHRIFQALVHRESDRFYSEELTQRETLSLPPFKQMTRLRFQHSDEAKLTRIALSARQYALKACSESIEILGPYAVGTGSTRAQEITFKADDLTSMYATFARMVHVFSQDVDVRLDHPR